MLGILFSNAHFSITWRDFLPCWLKLYEAGWPQGVALAHTGVVRLLGYQFAWAVAAFPHRNVTPDESSNSEIKVSRQSFLIGRTEVGRLLFWFFKLTCLFLHKSLSSTTGLKMSDPFGRKRSKGVFATLVSKGDWLYTRLEYKKAIESYTTVSSWLLNTDDGSRFITLSSSTNLTSASQHYMNNLLSSSGSVSEAQRQDLLCRPLQVLPEAGPVCWRSNRRRCFLSRGKNILRGERPGVVFCDLFWTQEYKRNTNCSVTIWRDIDWRKCQASCGKNKSISRIHAYKNSNYNQRSWMLFWYEYPVSNLKSAKHQFALFKGTVPEGRGALSHGRVWICTNVLSQRAKAAPANRRVPAGHSESHQGHRGHHR